MASGTIQTFPDVSALSFFKFDSQSSTSDVFNIPSNYRGVLFAVTNAIQYSGLYMIYSLSSGAVTVDAVKAASGFTITTATNKITIAHSSASIRYLFINLANAYVSV